MDFNFKKLISKPGVSSQNKMHTTVSFREGGQVKLGVPDMAHDSSGPTEMQQVSSVQQEAP